MFIKKITKDTPMIILFKNIIYDNFIELSKDPLLKHTKEDIDQLLQSESMRGFYIRDNDKIIAYLFGEIIILNDGRKVFFISYIFVSPQYRNKKIGNYLMDKIINTFTLDNLYDGIMLICNTNDKFIFNFYSKKEFIYDKILRRYLKYDVLYKKN